MARFSSILIANRGEIACRVIRSAKSLGYHTVAVYSEVDATAPHVQMADEAVWIGAGPVGESYLVADNILAAARQSGAEAIHPGYGFFSENAEFARSCEAAGLVFIGPSAEAIDLMGNKAKAKRRMLEAGVPCVPGYEGRDQSDAVLVSEAKKIGLPIMVKAVAGGGGRGMRLVHHWDELNNAIKLARSEAENAFGSDELILEKAIIRPRHVEVQVFADSQGNTVYMGERDCSVQRRHQKVVEEAPCPIMDDALREKMGAAAVAAAKSIAYRGAGTVEFLLDEQGSFYFLEMNTRLQVEHPVTELITGLDLVALQFQVAQGEALGLVQEDINLSGHAIEVRLYAEDPAQDFLPTAGPVDLWMAPEGVGIRVDSGICSGQAVSAFYDPLVAKIIASGPNREVARRRLIEALKRTALFGIKNNKDFLVACLEKRTFIDGAATTAFIAEEFESSQLCESIPRFEEAAVAAVLDLNQAYRSAFEYSVVVAPGLKNWSSAAALVSRKHYRFGDVEYDLSISPISSADSHERYRVTGSDSTIDIELLSVKDNVVHVGIGNAQYLAHFLSMAIGQLYLCMDGRSAFYRDELLLQGKQEEGSAGGRLCAPMHGVVLEVLVKPGDVVNRGQCLLVLEAMKMQHEMLAPVDGTVIHVTAVAGAQIPADELLIEIEPRLSAIEELENT